MYIYIMNKILFDGSSSKQRKAVQKSSKRNFIIIILFYSVVEGEISDTSLSNNDGPKATSAWRFTKSDTRVAHVTIDGVNVMGE